MESTKGASHWPECNPGPHCLSDSDLALISFVKKCITIHMEVVLTEVSQNGFMDLKQVANRTITGRRSWSRCPLSGSPLATLAIFPRG